MFVIGLSGGIEKGSKYMLHGANFGEDRLRIGVWNDGHCVASNEGWVAGGLLMPQPRGDGRAAVNIAHVHNERDGKKRRTACKAPKIEVAGVR